MIIGHLGVSYVLSQTPALFGHPIPAVDQAAIVAAGYVLDWDLLLPGKKGGSNHHYSPTHTPIFALLMYGVIYLIFQSIFQPITMLLIGVSMFLHLVCDDLDFWYSKLGFKKEIKDAQIIWLYPLVKRPQSIVAKRTKQRLPIVTAIGYYIRHPLIVKTELALVATAAFLFGIQTFLHWTAISTSIALFLNNSSRL